MHVGFRGVDIINTVKSASSLSFLGYYTSSRVYVLAKLFESPKKLAYQLLNLN